MMRFYFHEKHLICVLVRVTVSTEEINLIDFLEQRNGRIEKTKIKEFLFFLSFLSLFFYYFICDKMYLFNDKRAIIRGVMQANRKHVPS